MTFLLLRAARMAASLRRLAMSAPLKPLVKRARFLKVNIGRQRLVAGMHLEYGFPAFDIGDMDINLAVEPARPQ